jgi:hypothetical protein
VPQRLIVPQLPKTLSPCPAMPLIVIVPEQKQPFHFSFRNQPPAQLYPMPAVVRPVKFTNGLTIDSVSLQSISLLRLALQRQPPSSLHGHPNQQILSFSLTDPFGLWRRVPVLPTHNDKLPLTLRIGRSQLLYFVLGALAYVIAALFPIHSIVRKQLHSSLCIL